MRKILFYLNLLSLCLSLSCTDDAPVIKRNAFGSSLEISNNHKISLFTLSNKLLQITMQESCMQVELQSHSSGETLNLKGEIREAAENLTGVIFIPKQIQIADSDYDVIFKNSNGVAYGARFKVTIKDEMLYKVLDEEISYMGLNGSGNENDPYLIGTEDEYYSFLSNLLRDSLTHGANLHFMQTASFNAPSEGHIAENSGYPSLPFAGHYNGNGFCINDFYYTGTGNDTHVGLFSELLNGAVIQNLHINIRYIQNAGYTGAIAGSTKGDVTLLNVSASGSFSNMDHQVGGLIGYASGGTLTINNSCSKISITGTNNIGGLIGKAENNSTIILQNDTVWQMALNGDLSVGGAIGHLDGSIEASDILIHHTVDDEKTKVLMAKSRYAGGLIGHALIKGNSHIKNIKIECPIESPQDAGGLIGNLTPSANIQMEGCKINYSVYGKTSVGGLIGNIDSNSGTITFGKYNIIAVMNESNIVISGYDDSENVGGVIGLCQNANLNFTSPVNIATSVKGALCVGGFFGKIISRNATTFTISDMWKHDNLMHVEGIQNVGGFVGYAENLTLQDKMVFTLKNSGYQEHLKGNSAFCGTVGISGSTQDAGCIAGYAKNCKFENIYSDGTLYGYRGTGGIVGSGSSVKLSFCVSDLTKHEAGGPYNGGIAGYLDDSDIDVCVNYSTLNNGSDCTGGIVGLWKISSGDKTLSNSVNVGTISGNKKVGGLIGYIEGDNHKKTISNSANYGAISGTGTNNCDDAIGLGGLIGFGKKRITIQGCANHGNVSGKENYHGVGGIAGSLGEDPTGQSNCDNNIQVNTSCNFGTISAANSTKVGGLVGYFEEGCMNDYDIVRLENCYNMGEIPSNCSDDTGGLVGLISFYGRLRLSYNAGKVSDGNAILGTDHGYLYHVDDTFFLEKSGKGWKGTSLSDSKMRNLDNFKNFSKDIWKTDASVNKGYPYLIDCPYQFIDFSL